MKRSSRVCTVGLLVGKATRVSHARVWAGVESEGSECQSAAAALERFSTEQPVRHNTGHQHKAATHWLPAWYSTGHSLCAAAAAAVDLAVAREPETAGVSGGIWTPPGLSDSGWNYARFSLDESKMVLAFSFSLSRVEFTVRRCLGVAFLPPSGPAGGKT